MARKVIFVTTKLKGYAGMTAAKVQNYAKQGLDALYKTLKGTGYEFQLAFSTGGGFAVLAGDLSSTVYAVTNYGSKTILLNRMYVKTPNQVRTALVHEGFHAAWKGVTHAQMQTLERKAKALVITYPL